MLQDQHSNPNTGTAAGARSVPRRRGTSRFLAACMSAALLGAGAVGCGGDDPVDMPSGGHGHIEIGSTNRGSGDLGMILPSTTIEVTEGETVGSLTLWTSTSPAINTLQEDDRAAGLFVLSDGVPISLELAALDPGVQFQYGETTVDAPGESVEIGPVPFHDHGTWQVALPEGVHTGEYDISFRFTAASQYAPSEVVTFTLVPSEGHHGEDDGHGDDGDDEGGGHEEGGEHEE